MIIAIDGPAGTGKSTVAKMIAARLDFTYLDTGAMYRAVTYRALETGTRLDDAEALTRLAQSEPISFASGGTVLISGEDVTAQIRTPEVDANVSTVSAVPGVRQALTEQQRAFAASNDVVMEGRDIGTVVFPHAEVKVFLTASAEERAARRASQNAQRGSGSTDPAVILEQIQERDRIDSTRATAPLKAADDATVVDTTSLSVDQVVDAIASLASERGARDPQKA